MTNARQKAEANQQAKAKPEQPEAQREAAEHKQGQDQHFFKADTVIEPASGDLKQ
ncbi:hypothetical protein ACVWVV_003503 [Ewingella americana]